MTKKANHYIDNKKMYSAIVEYKQKRREALEAGEEVPRIPEYLGQCIKEIAENLSLKGNFVNYPFRRDMVSDGIENCLVYFNNFNEEKYKNPFAYFTQIIYFAYLRRIAKEKKELVGKQKYLEKMYVEGTYVDSQEGDVEHGLELTINNDYMNNLVENYEKKKINDKSRRKRSKAESVVSKSEE